MADPVDVERKMSLAHACDALEDYVMRFHNEMLGEKEELPPREWARRFRSWFSEYEFERDYIETMKFIEECERRDNRASLPETP